MGHHPFLWGFIAGVGAVWVYHNFAGPHLPGSTKG